MRISDWSSDVCSSDLSNRAATHRAHSASPFVVAGSPVLDVSNRMSALTRSTTSASALAGPVTVTIRTIGGVAGFGSGLAGPTAFAAPTTSEWRDGHRKADVEGKRVVGRVTMGG